MLNRADKQIIETFNALLKLAKDLGTSFTVIQAKFNELGFDNFKRHINNQLQTTDFGGSSSRLRENLDGLLGSFINANTIKKLYSAIANARIEILARRVETTAFNLGFGGDSMRDQINNYVKLLNLYLTCLLPTVVEELKTPKEANKEEADKKAAEKKAFLLSCGDPKLWSAIGDNVVTEEELQDHLIKSIQDIMEYKKQPNSKTLFIHGVTVNDVMAKYFGIKNVNNETCTTQEFTDFQTKSLAEQEQRVRDAIDALQLGTSGWKAATSYLTGGTYNDQFEFVEKKLKTLLPILQVALAQQVVTPPSQSEKDKEKEAAWNSSKAEIYQQMLNNIRSSNTTINQYIVRVREFLNHSTTTKEEATELLNNISRQLETSYEVMISEGVTISLTSTEALEFKKLLKPICDKVNGIGELSAPGNAPGSAAIIGAIGALKSTSSNAPSQPLSSSTNDAAMRARQSLKPTSNQTLRSQSSSSSSSTSTVSVVPSQPAEWDVPRDIVLEAFNAIANVVLTPQKKLNGADKLFLRKVISFINESTTTQQALEEMLATALNFKTSETTRRRIDANTFLSLPITSRENNRDGIQVNVALVSEIVGQFLQRIRELHAEYLQEVSRLTSSSSSSSSRQLR